MTYTELVKNIKSKQFKPLYLLHGEESYYIDKLSKLLEETVLSPSEKAFNMTIAYANEVDTRKIIDTANQYPMMSPFRLVIIKEAQALKNLEVLIPYVKSPNPQTILVFCHKHRKVDARKLIFKTMKKSDDCILFESKKPYENTIPSWISKELSSIGYQIDPQAGMLMAEYLGTDLSKIRNEIDKLIIHIDKSTAITPDDIQKHIGISKDYNVFELQKVIGQRNMTKALRIVNYFSENPKSGPLPMVTASLYGYIMKLLMTKTNSNQSNQQLASIIGGSPYFMQEYKTAATKYSYDELKNAIGLLAQLDQKSKGIGIRGIKYKGLMQEFIYNLMSH